MAQTYADCFAVLESFFTAGTNPLFPRPSEYPDCGSHGGHEERDFLPHEVQPVTQIKPQSQQPQSDARTCQLKRRVPARRAMRLPKHSALNNMRQREQTGTFASDMENVWRHPGHLVFTKSGDQVETTNTGDGTSS